MQTTTRPPFHLATRGRSIYYFPADDTCQPSDAISIYYRPSFDEVWYQCAKLTGLAALECYDDFAAAIKRHGMLASMLADLMDKWRTHPAAYQYMRGPSEDVWELGNPYA